MRITAISDTHTKHSQLNLPGGDLLIHGGDLSNRGSFGDLESFLYWFGKQDYKHKVFIAGNHDFCFQDSPGICKAILKEHEEYNGNITYLEDSEITIEGLKIWGSPWQPEFYNWAFKSQPKFYKCCRYRIARPVVRPARGCGEPVRSGQAARGRVRTSHARPRKGRSSGR